MYPVKRLLTSTPFAVQTADVEARFAPLQSGRAITKLTQGATYFLVGETEKTEGCPTRWLRLQRVSFPSCKGSDPTTAGGQCFPDTEDNGKDTADYLGQVPDVWVCEP